MFQGINSHLGGLGNGGQQDFFSKGAGHIFSGFSRGTKTLKSANRHFYYVNAIDGGGGDHGGCRHHHLHLAAVSCSLIVI